MTPPSQMPITSLTGLLPVSVMLVMIAQEYSHSPLLAGLVGLLGVATVATFAPRASASRLIFILIGMALVIWAALSRPDWLDATLRAMQRGAMVIALFTALSAIRSAATTSRQILDCGRFLARQPPGLRYIALSIGGHLFGLILLYGSISLLGSLVTENNAKEADALLRRHRTRRMMVAIQRGFASTLCWSPLGFSMAITIAIVPGANWPAVALPCIVSASLMIAVGWALDTIFKPRLVTPPPLRQPETGRWLVELQPLLMLLAVVISGVLALHVLTGVEVIGAVMAVVPLVALLWVAVQPRPERIGVAAWVGSRVMQFITRDMPTFHGEIVLLFMAGFIGSLGAVLLVPLAQAQGVDLTAVSPLVIVVALVWLVPITGQLGMNPILAVSLIVPLLPSAQDMSISPAALVAAITGGWALSGATSPFTASVLISARLGGVSAHRAGLGWNGLYIGVMGIILSLWVMVLAIAL